MKKNDLIDAIKKNEIWLTLGINDIKMRYRRSVVGPLWITLSMAIFCFTLGIIYSKLFNSNIRELLPFLSIGLITWTYISGFLGEAPNLYVDNANYIKDIKINLFSINLRSLIRHAIIFLHNFIILILILIYFDLSIKWCVLLFPIGFLLITINLLNFGVILSLIGARFRDLMQIVQNTLQLIFFITPIFWFPRLLPEGSLIVEANPVSHLLNLVRMPLLGEVPGINSWLIGCVTFTASFYFAIYLYKKKSSKVVFWI